MSKKFQPEWEQKCWGWVQHIFANPQAAVSNLKVDPGWMCSRHCHGARYNMFAVTSGTIVVEEWNNEIRREKFDILLPQIMRERNIDMWIHVMRIRIPDLFGAEELGSTSGVFVFTDRGGDRIERAVLGRRWGATQRERGPRSTIVDDSEAYDIIAPPVRVQEPVGGPMSEYDYRFKDLREFVTERDPKRIAVNFMKDLGPWVTYTDFGGALDGLSHTDYLLLSEEIGEEYARRLVSSEYLIMDYTTRKVPSEIAQLKKLRQEQEDNLK